MFSKTCEYAIRAVVYIASVTNESVKVGIEDIINHVHAPRHFTAKVLQTLSKKQIINSQKGVNGGFFIDETQRLKTLKDLVIAIDGDKIFTGCGLGLKQCSDAQPCPMHYQFKSVRDALNRMMEETTIDTLALKLKGGESVLTQ